MHGVKILGTIITEGWQQGKPMLEVNFLWEAILRISSSLKKKSANLIRFWSISSIENPRELSDRNLSGLLRITAYFLKKFC